MNRRLTASPAIELHAWIAVLAPKIRKWWRNKKSESDETEMKDSAATTGQYGAAQSNCWAPRNYTSHGAGRGSTDGVPRLACYRWGEGRRVVFCWEGNMSLCQQWEACANWQEKRWIFKDGKNGRQDGERRGWQREGQRVRIKKRTKEEEGMWGVGGQISL